MSNPSSVISASHNTPAIRKKAADEKSPPPFDPWLDETERILEDYVGLLAGKEAGVAHQ